MSQDKAAQRSGRRGGRREMDGGFTIVELMVVTAMIILLLSILLVALNAATRVSQKTRTLGLMDAMKKGLVRFKADVGYYPPVLGVPYKTTGPGTGTIAADDLRRLYLNSVPDPASSAYSGGATYKDHMQEYYSTCTLAEYLIGYGHHYQDGWGEALVSPYAGDSLRDWSCKSNPPNSVAAPCESPRAGIRHPGPDGIWNATRTTGSNYGAISQRMMVNGAQGNENTPNSFDQGKVLGPYIDLKDDRLLAGVNYGSNGLETYFKGDTLPDAGLPDDEEWEKMPKAIVDYWGMPIRYYRRPYPTGALNQSYRSVFDPAISITSQQFTNVPTLSDIFVLRPWSMKSGTEIEGIADAGGKRATTTQLENGEFALLSAGPDKRVGANNKYTFDEDGYNEDNIVEVGP